MTNKNYYVVVPSSLSKMLNGHQPHVLPGINVDYCSTKELYIEYNHQLPETPNVAVQFEVPMSAIRNPVVCNIPGLLAPKVSGTLPVNSIKECTVNFGKDILNRVGHTVYEQVNPGSVPTYRAARKYAQQRADSHRVLNSILAATDAKLAAETKLSLSLSFPYNKEQAPSVASRAANILQTLLTTDTLATSTNYFRPGIANFYVNGIMYAENTGMDLPMRTIQKVMQHMLPQLDVQSVSEMQILIDALRDSPMTLPHDNPQNVTKCVNKALDTFKEALAPKFANIVTATQEALPEMVRNATQEMQAEPAKLLLKAIYSTPSFFGSRNCSNSEASLIGSFLTRRNSIMDKNPNMTYDEATLCAAKQIYKDAYNNEIKLYIKADDIQCNEYISQDNGNNSFTGDDNKDEHEEL